MTRKPLLLLGAGGHAKACIDIIEQQGIFNIVGLLGLPNEVGTQLLGYSVLGTDDDLSSYLGENVQALITVGQIKTPAPRIRLFELMRQNGREMPIIVSPHAYVSPHAMLGEGSIVMHGAIINAGAVIGRNCIINSRALVEHDVRIGDHCHISTSAVINGGVEVAEGTFIGSGSCVRQGIRIGKHCVIGMGQQILADCAAETSVPMPRKTS